MDIEMIESKLGEILEALEKEAMDVVMDESLDKMHTNLKMKPLASTKQILTNALDSIKMVDRISKEEPPK